jgi:hypothetical protein
MVAKKLTVFVSYSHHDRALIAPLVKLVEMSGSSVFRDDDSLASGDLWRVEIDSAIARCHIMLVFWCSHAAVSLAVESEYQQAIILGKRLVPVLLDDTTMSDAIAEYQAIDLRPLGAHVRVPHFGFADDEMSDRDRELAIARMEQHIQRRMVDILVDWLRHNVEWSEGLNTDSRSTA